MDHQDTKIFADIPGRKLELDFPRFQIMVDSQIFEVSYPIHGDLGATLSKDQRLNLDVVCLSDLVNDQ